MNNVMETLKAGMLVRHALHPDLADLRGRVVSVYQENGLYGRLVARVIWSNGSDTITAVTDLVAR